MKSNKENQPCMVSIVCDVYNHEPYLRDCLEGFVKQVVDFPYEILIHDDCSTDKSVEIIKEYVAKYPHLFKPIYQKENQYSKGVGIWEKYQFPRAQGKYIAMCEGDDYWTDPYKLQKQVDFLESHPEFSLCFSRVKCLLVKTGQLVNELIVCDMPGQSSLKDLAKGNYIHTPSVLLRNNIVVLNKIKSLGYCMPGDYVNWMLFAETGKIWKFEEPMAVYRVGSGIWSSDESISPDLEMLMTLNKLWMAIDDAEVKNILQEQISKQKQAVLDFVAHQKRDLDGIRSSKAYRFGCWLLKPFKVLLNK